MKKYHVVLAIISLLFLHGCTQEEATTSSSKTKVSFSLSSAGTMNGRRQTSDFQNITGAVITLTTPAGENVMSYQRINLIAFGDSFVTEPVELEAGHYVLTDFFLTGDSSKVMYATPHKGSFLGVLPKQPLDRDFSVAWGKTSTMAMEVVEVEGYSPEDFGYKSFSVTALKFFALSVKIEKDGKSVFTTAEASLLHGADTIAKYKVGTSPTLIKFSEIPGAEYDLAIIKDGYARYTKHFKFNELLTDLNHKPLVANLTPAFTLRYNGNGNIGWELNSHSFQTWVVNWGDGSIETFEIDSLDYYTPIARLWHAYSSGSPKSHFVSVTGESNDVYGYTSIEVSDGNWYALNLDVFQNLTSVNLFQGGDFGQPLDLRKNEELQSIILYGVNEILLPKRNNFNYLKIHSAIQSLDYIIDNVYSNTVRTNTQGMIDFSTEYYSSDEENSTVPLAIPNASSMTKLKALRDKYHWTIYPHLGTF